MIELKEFMYLGAVVSALGKKGVITEMPTNVIKGKEYVYSMMILIDGEKEPVKYHPDDVKEFTEKQCSKDLARELFAENLKYSDISRADIEDLKSHIIEALSDFENNCFKMYLNKTKAYIHNVFKDGRLVSYSIRCTGVIQYPNKAPITHFKDREAITFNRDGFIGFCGWADSENSKPFVKAFRNWVDKKTLPFS